MKKLFAIAAIGLFVASTAMAGSTYVDFGCDDGMGMAEGDMSTPVKIVLETGTVTPKPKTGS